VLFFPLHFFKVFIIGPFVLCGGLFGFLKLLPMFKKKKKFNPKKVQFLFLAPRDVSSNPWCEIMEKMLKGKGAGEERGQRQMASLFKGLNSCLIFFFYF